MNDEKEVIMSQSKVLSWHLSGGAEENYKKTLVR
jgi:hypothetical protein